MHILLHVLSSHFSTHPICQDSSHIWSIWAFSRREYSASLKEGRNRRREVQKKKYKRERVEETGIRNRKTTPNILTIRSTVSIKEKVKGEKARNTGTGDISGRQSVPRQNLTPAVCFPPHIQVGVWRCSHSANVSQVSQMSPPLHAL